MNYVLSDDTARKLKDILASAPQESLDHGSGSGGRQVIFLIVDSAIDESVTPPTYQGRPCSYNPTTKVWKYFSTCSIIDANSQKIATGKRYLGIRHGVDADDTTWFVVDGGKAPSETCLKVLTGFNSDNCTFSYKYILLPEDHIFDNSGCT